MLFFSFFLICDSGGSKKEYFLLALMWTIYSWSFPHMCLSVHMWSIFSIFILSCSVSHIFYTKSSHVVSVLTQYMYVTGEWSWSYVSRRGIILYEANPMSGVLWNIDRRVWIPPPLVRGEDTLAGWRGGGELIVSEAARHCSVLYIWKYFVMLALLPPPPPPQPCPISSPTLSKSQWD
jgi:hypothetical protein